MNKVTVLAEKMKRNIGGTRVPFRETPRGNKVKSSRSFCLSFFLLGFELCLPAFRGLGSTLIKMYGTSFPRR